MAYDIAHLRELDRLAAGDPHDAPGHRAFAPRGDLRRSRSAAVGLDGWISATSRRRLCDAVDRHPALRHRGGSGGAARSIATSLQLTLDGEVAFRTEQFETMLSPGTLFVMNPGLRYRKTWSRDAQQLMIKIPRRRLLLRPMPAAAVPLCRTSIAARPARDDGLMDLIAHLCRDLGNARGLDAHARPAARDGGSVAVGT